MKGGGGAPGSGSASAWGCPSRAEPWPRCSTGAAGHLQPPPPSTSRDDLASDLFFCLLAAAFCSRELLEVARGGPSPEPLWEVRAEPVPALACPSVSKHHSSVPAPSLCPRGSGRGAELGAGGALPWWAALQKHVPGCSRGGRGSGALPGSNAPLQKYPAAQTCPGSCLQPAACTPRMLGSHGGTQPGWAGACRPCPHLPHQAAFFQPSSSCGSTFAIAQARGSPLAVFPVLCSALVPPPAPCLASTSSLKNARLQSSSVPHGPSARPLHVELDLTVGSAHPVGQAAPGPAPGLGSGQQVHVAAGLVALLRSVTSLCAIWVILLCVELHCRGLLPGAWGNTASFPNRSRP